MQVKCRLCGEDMEIGADVVPGQKVRCPFCNGKFEYAVNANFEITEKDLALAIAECRKNEADNRYYSAAPAGARLFIGLIFYGRVFHDTVDFGKYKTALTELESELDKGDWDYLIKNESDPELISYFESVRTMARPASADPSSRETIVAKSVSRKKPVLGVIRKTAGGPNNDTSEKREGEASPSAKRVSERPSASAGRFHVGSEARIAGLINELEKLRRRLRFVLALVPAVALMTALVAYALTTSTSSRNSRTLDELKYRNEYVERDYESATNEIGSLNRELDEKRQTISRLKREIASQRKESEHHGERPETTSETKVSDSLVSDAELAEKITNRAADVWQPSDGESFPVSASGKVFCAIPASTGVELFEIEITSSGTTTTYVVSRHLSNESSVSISSEALGRTVAEKGCLFVRDGNPVICCSDSCREAKYEVPKDGATICPSDLLLPGIADLLRKVGGTTEKVEVVIRLENRRGVSIPVTVCDIGNRIGSEIFYEAVEKSIIETKVLKAKGVGRKPRQTVMLCGGVSDCIRDGIRFVRVAYPDLTEGECIYGRKNRVDCPCLGCNRWRRYENDRKVWKRQFDEARRQALAVASWRRDVQAFAARKGIVANRGEVLAALSNAVVRLALNRKVGLPYTEDERSADSVGFGVVGKEVAYDDSEAGGSGFSADAFEAQALPVQDKKPQQLVEDEDVGTPRLLRNGKLQSGYVKELVRALKVKSFCGIDFGYVEEGCDGSSGRGGALAKKFRMFSQYSVFGTDRFHRIDRVTLHGEIDHPDEQNITREVDRVKDILDNKYSLSLRKMIGNSQKENHYEDETDCLKVALKTYVHGDRASIQLEFTNKQVGRQDAAISARVPHVDVSIPAGAGADVL